MLEHSEYIELKDEIKKELTAQLSAEFVHKDDCNRIVKGEDDKIDQIMMKFTENNTKLNILIGILVTIAVPVVGVCVSYLFGG